MSIFIQLHFLTSYPPSNLNRDDMGRPKTAKMGGVDRLRISSQSLKRAWRTSELFESILAGHIGVRTKQIGIKIYNNLIGGGLSPKLAEKCAQLIADVFGKRKKEAKDNPLLHLEIEQLVHLSQEEWNKIDELCALLIKKNREPLPEELKLLTRERQAVDVALFGRMLANTPKYNVEAAAQVAHALSVHPVAIEEDYFTAVDDLNTESTGAAHIGETGFAAALFYHYVCINRDLLLENLDHNEILVKKSIRAITETVIKVAPTGKQNSFGSRAYASYILAEKMTEQPRSLASSFLKAITGSDYATDSIKALRDEKKSLDFAYNCTPSSYEMNVLEGIGNIQELIEFVST